MALVSRLGHIAVDGDERCAHPVPLLSREHLPCYPNMLVGMSHHLVKVRHTCLLKQDGGMTCYCYGSAHAMPPYPRPVGLWSKLEAGRAAGRALSRRPLGHLPAALPLARLATNGCRCGGEPPSVTVRYPMPRMRRGNLWCGLSKDRSPRFRGTAIRTRHGFQLRDTA